MLADLLDSMASTTVLGMELLMVLQRDCAEVDWSGIVKVGMWESRMELWTALWSDD